MKQPESKRTLYVTDLAKYKGQMKDQKEYMQSFVRAQNQTITGVDERLGGGNTSHYR